MGNELWYGYMATLIAINLLPWRAIERQRRLKKWGILSVVAFLLSLILLGWGYHILQQQLNTLEKAKKHWQFQLEKTNAEYQQSLAIQARIDQFNDLNKLQLNYAAQFQKWLDVLKLCTQLLPDDVYFTTLQMNNSQIQISGRTVAQVGLTLIMQKIMSAKVVDKVELQNMVNATDNKTEWAFKLLLTLPQNKETQ